MRALIIGEAGEIPWANSDSGRRLCRWFGVKDREELLARGFLLDNVCRVKGEKLVEAAHLRYLREQALGADLVFMVGKFAQRWLCDFCYEDPCWQVNQWVGIPHPSGLNHALNCGGDARVEYFVRQVLSDWRPADRPLDFPREVRRCLTWSWT